ncbi:hypothetical protein C8R45DRAFT_926702 [Mycena sanguinolenta]|nr:hypothetical protein C8R45DRAFT_926702 [Mycena sanguinolenta]
MYCKKIPVLFSLFSDGYRKYLRQFRRRHGLTKAQKNGGQLLPDPQELEFDLLPSPYLSIAKMLEFSLPLQNSAISGFQPGQFFSKELPISLTATYKFVCRVFTGRVSPSHSPKVFSSWEWAPTGPSVISLYMLTDEASPPNCKAETPREFKGSLPQIWAT